MKTVLWTSPSLHSADFFRLIPLDEGFRLRGTINLLLERQPTKIDYLVDCDLNWVTRRVVVEQKRPDGDTHLNLTVDKDLNWHHNDTPLPWAAGLTDVDLSLTPATNMLPLRKHNLAIGQSREVNCVWVQPPAMTLSTLPQHYTRVDAHHYDYAAPSLDYKAVIRVDGDGIIVTYGDLWRQPGSP